MRNFYVVILLVTSFFSNCAHADDRHWYIGQGIGQSKLKLNNADFTIALSTSESKDEMGTAYKIYGGYRFNRYFSAEGGYTYLGKAKYRYETPLGNGEVTFKARSLNAFAVGGYPIGGFFLFGKLGIATVRTDRSDVELSGLCVFCVQASHVNTNFAWGTGFQYNFSNGLSIRLEYEDFGKIGTTENLAGSDTEPGRAKASLWNVGFLYHF